MTASQFAVVLVLLILVAGIGFYFGRSGRTQGGGTAAPAGGDAAGTPRPKAVPQARVAPGTAAPHGSTGSRAAGALADGGTGIRNWGYQLQNLDVGRAASSPFDLLVIDYAKDGSDDSALTPDELDRMKRKPDGSRRIVLAYLSIGEAESYRSYWQPSWKKNKPSWLLRENPEWEENYSVCFWDPEWQKIMCGPQSSRLDRIIAAGFDGVYLDKVDVYEDLQQHFKKVAATRPDIEGDMIDFVRGISSHAKSLKPDFLVIMQNAEGLIEKPELVAVIDGVAKEELVFGVDAPEKRNSAEDFDYSREMLDRIKDQGKMVLVVEYLNAPAKVREAADVIDKLGYILYVSDKNRDLDKLNYTTLEA